MLTNTKVGWCKTVEYYRDFREKNRERRRLIERTSYKKRYKEIKKKRKFDTPKVKARALLGQAVFYGKIIKPEMCSLCKKTMPKRLIHGHHEDYSKPYDVEWLCSICHGIRHRRIELKSLRGAV